MKQLRLTRVSFIRTVTGNETDEMLSKTDIFRVYGKIKRHFDQIIRFPSFTTMSDMQLDESSQLEKKNFNNY